MMNDYRLNMREEIYMKADLFDNIFTVLAASNRNNCDERVIVTIIQKFI